MTWNTWCSPCVIDTVVPNIPGRGHVAPVASEWRSTSQYSALRPMKPDCIHVRHAARRQVMLLFWLVGATLNVSSRLVDHQQFLVGSLADCYVSSFVFTFGLWNTVPISPSDLLLEPLKLGYLHPFRYILSLRWHIALRVVLVMSIFEALQSR